MVRLNVRVVTEYTMPSICCACGEPAGPARFKVYASSWSRRQPFTVGFPLCRACEKAYLAVDGRRRLGCWSSVGVAFLVAVVGVVGEALGWAGFSSGLTFLLFFGVLLLGIVASLVIPLLFPPDVRQPYRRVLRAAQIKNYHPSGFLGQGTMTLVLAHEPFAAAFQQLNEPVILR